MNKSDNQPSSTIETATIDYLRQNPDVLMAYPEVFATLTVPHPSGGMTSLVERQLKILRQKNQALEQSMANLVKIAHENETVHQRFHQLTLELICTHQLDDVPTIVQNQVQKFFNTDFVCFHFLFTMLERDSRFNAHCLNGDSGVMEVVTTWLERRQTICGRQDEKINRALFGDGVDIGSSAIIPLFHQQDLGLLCLGSAGESRFNDAMGTIFLQQLGELVSIRVQALSGI